MESQVLFKPNQLIRSVLDVNSNDYKIFNLALQKTQLKLYELGNKDNILIPVCLSPEEIKEIYKNNNENRLTDVFKTLEKLCKVPIKWKDENKIIISTLFSSVEIDSKNFNIVAYIDIKVVKVLNQYRQKGYTPIDLGLTKKANGFYSVRLYELLRSWCNTKRIIEISLIDLKATLAIENVKSYDNFANLRIKVIDRAIAEIKEKMNMEITYNVTKKNKKVNTIIFKVLDYGSRHYDFNSKSNGLVEQNKNEMQITEEMPSGYEPEGIQIRLLSYGIRISANTLKLKQEEYGEQLFIKAVKILEDRVQDAQQEKLKAPVRYLTGILDNLKNKSNKTTAPQIQQPNKKINFANFTQREYDFDKLEKQLLGWDDGEDEDDE